MSKPPSATEDFLLSIPCLRKKNIKEPSTPVISNHCGRPEWEIVNSTAEGHASSTEITEGTGLGNQYTRMKANEVWK